MQDLTSRLSTLKRPGLLIRAARIGAESYRRNPHLYRLLGYSAPRRNGAAILKLIEIEEQMNDKRHAADASYSVSSHVDILMAMMGEARLMLSSD